MSHAALAQKVGDKAIDSIAIHNWLSYGTRLTYLAAASSAYILPLIAVCSLRYKVTKEDWVDLIQELGFILSCPHQPDFEHVLSKDCGQIIRDLIVPQMVWIKQMSTHLEETICFNEVSRMTHKLCSLDTK
ncbi:hypothetical protein C8R47DRAFT_1231091 [Mycena vitilis]|nr:hypothetical protein C8R47DRAFT_1231091 [Mycena vitilis]